MLERPESLNYHPVNGNVIRGTRLIAEPNGNKV